MVKKPALNLVLTDVGVILLVLDILYVVHTQMVPEYEKGPSKA